MCECFGELGVGAAMPHVCGIMPSSCGCGDARRVGVESPEAPCGDQKGRLSQPVGRTLIFRVIGVPKPGGSKRAFVIPNTNRAIITDACKQNKSWRQDVAYSALAARAENPVFFESAISVEFTFIFQRPKSHTTKSGGLRKGVSAHHISAPDTTKLVRSTEDALTGVAWKDDRLIVIQTAVKRYADPGEPPGCAITIRELIDGRNRV